MTFLILSIPDLPIIGAWSEFERSRGDRLPSLYLRVMGKVRSEKRGTDEFLSTL
jgi:hypothetical protein